MIKIAVFTEGQTEQIFTKRLVEAISGGRNVAIETKKIIGGRKYPTIEMSVTDDPKSVACDLYVLIRDCGADERVISEMRDNVDNLANAGYKMLIGLRDLRPNFKKSDLPKLNAKFNSNVALNAPLECRLVVCIEEIEAWFVAEKSHFHRIDRRLTASNILDSCGVDIKGDSEKLVKPADTLDRIYKMVNLSYDKTRADVERTVNALDLKSLNPDFFKRAKSCLDLYETLQRAFDTAFPRQSKLIHLKQLFCRFFALFMRVPA